jgi:hypothetical protein
MINLNDNHYFHYFFPCNFVNKKTLNQLTLQEKIDIMQDLFIRNNMKMEFIKLDENELKLAIEKCSEYQSLLKNSKIIDIDNQICESNNILLENLDKEKYTWLCFKAISFINEDKVDWAFLPCQIDKNYTIIDLSSEYKKEII